MEVLLTGLEDAASGRGRLFVLAGEPGIGKSWLADELGSAARTRGFRVLWGRCWEAGGAPAYWPWVQVLRSLLRDGPPDVLRAQLGTGASHVAQILPEVHELFPGLPAPSAVNPDAARFCLFDAVTGFLRNVATAQPSVAILDDLHAADTPSLLLLQFLASELSEGRLLVLGTYRNTELGADDPLTATLSELARQPGTRSIPLGGLSRTEMARFIELTVGRAPSDRLLAAVHRETEGNPLFVREVVELLAHEGRLDSSEDAPFQGLGIPQGIKRIIGRRLGQLPDAWKHVLTVASILGREFDAEVVGGVAGLPRDRLVEALDEAVAARVVTEAPTPGQLRFSHALVRDVLYDDLSPSRRVSLHQRTGEVLEALYAGNLDPHLAELAHHFTEATPAGNAGKAIRYGRAAGDRAIQLLAYEEAVRLYRMALRASDAAKSRNDVERCELRLALGDAQARAGEFPAAKDTFLSAADLARTSRTPEHLARAALGYGGRFVWEAARGDRHLVPLLKDALAALGKEDSLLRVKVMARLAGGPMRDEMEREPRDAMSRRAVEMARRLGDPATLAYALDGRYAAVWWPENLEDRLTIATELIQAAEEAGDKERALQGHHYRCLARLERGDMPGVYADADAKARLAEELRQPAQEAYVVGMQATLALFEGRFADAEALIPRALALGQRAHGWMESIYGTLRWYALRREHARLEEVEERLQQAARDFPTYLVLRAVLAQLHTELGREDAAREIFETLAADDFAGVPRDDEWIFCLSLLADVAESLGDVPRAEALYRLLSPYAGRNALSNPDNCIGSVARSLGILAAMTGRWPEAIRHFEDALAMNARTNARPWLTRTQCDYARLLLTRNTPGDRERARDLLARARWTCQELGMTALATRVSALLEAGEGGLADGAPGGPESGAPPGSSHPAMHASVFRREGEYWSIAFEGQIFRLKDAKGLRYLGRLLEDPGREFHVLDLVALEEGLSETLGSPPREVDRAARLGDAGPVLDPEAKVAYRRRLEELEAEIAEAERWRDLERARRAREEKAFLVQAMAGAVGLGGRDRLAASAAERARINVTRAIKAALARIQAHSPALGRHLARTVRTGIYCSYAPDPRFPGAWLL
jgi:tetratricopeptide (TPR) repeat protein